MSEFTQSETLAVLEYSRGQNNQNVTFNKNKLTLKTYQRMNFENGIQKCSKNLLLQLVVKGSIITKNTSNRTQKSPQRKLQLFNSFQTPTSYM